MRTKVLTISLVLLLTILPLATLSSVAAPGLPALGVTVESVSDVESDPVEYVHVKTTATVTVENFPLGATVTVNATAMTWLVEVSPLEFTVASGSTTAHTETINLDISVRPRASAERDVELRVFANTTNTIGIEYSDEAVTNISVRQFYGLRLSSNGTMSLEQAKNLTARMRITNTGNGLDNFTISLNNEATLDSMGLTVTYDEFVHEVGRDRTVSVVIEVNAAEDADITMTDALFTVRSVGDTTKTAIWQLSITVTKGEDGNGGNGGNGGNNGGGEEQSGLSTNALYGIVLAIVILVIGGFLLARRAGEMEAEDEDYVVGKDKDAEDRN